MKTSKSIFSNPYKTRLWLANYNSNTFNDRQKRLWFHLASWGPKGCDSWNYRLAQEFHVCKRTIQYDLRKLSDYHLIKIRVGWAKLQGDGFAGELRGRKIIALPWKNEATWRRESIREIVGKTGANFCTLQRRLTKSKINQPQKSLQFRQVKPADERVVLAGREELSKNHPPEPPSRGVAVQTAKENRQLQWILTNARRRNRVRKCR
jgi:hypothetical protein